MTARSSAATPGGAHSSRDGRRSQAGHFTVFPPPLRSGRFSGQLGSGSTTAGRAQATGLPAPCATVNCMVQCATVDRAFVAFADPTRRAVLERLGAGGASIGELAEPFDMSLTGMKKHMAQLEEANVVRTEKVGRVRRRAVVPHAFEAINTWLQRLDRFQQVVEHTKGAR